MYKFRSSQKYYYGPVLVLVLTRVDSDHIGANELIDSHANITPETNTTTRKKNQTMNYCFDEIFRGKPMNMSRSC